MHLLGQTALGIAVISLLAALVVVKRLATGSLLERPQGPPLAAAVNGFNLLFLLVVNPMAGALLIARRLDAVDATRIPVAAPWLVAAVETLGLALYLSGFGLMGWALTALGRNYQLGGSAPRPGDTMVAVGPYRLVRHPMYAAALLIAGGLACLTQSGACLAVLGTYLVLILLLLPVEEEGLRRAYGERYAAYRRATGTLLPSLLRPRGAGREDRPCTS